MVSDIPAGDGKTANLFLQCSLSFRGMVHTTEYIEVEMKKGSVSALSAGAYAATLYVMVNIVEVGGREPPTLASLG